MSFTWIDGVILLIVGFGLWRGFLAGFIHQAAHIAGLVLGFIFGIRFMYPAGRLLTGMLDFSEQAAPLLGFVLVFLGILLAVIFLAQLVERLMGAINLSTLNRLLGGVLGALEAVLLISVMLWVTDPLNFPGEEIRTDSLLVEPIEVVAETAWNYTADLWPEINRLSREIGARGADRVPFIAGPYGSAA